MSSERPSIIGCLAVILILLATTAGRGENAATLYEQAAKAVRAAQDEAERRVMFDVMATPVNEALAGTVDHAARALALFDRASEAVECQWSLPVGKPLAAAQMARVYGIDDVVILRARLRASRGDSAGALEDCRRLIMMGRRIEQVKSLARQSQGGHLHNKAISTIGLIAPAVPLDQLARFVKEIDRLPLPVIAADVIAAEKPTFVRTHRKLVEDPSAREMLSGMSELMEDMVGAKSEPLKVDDLVADPALREATFKEIDALFDEMAAVLRVPPVEGIAQWDKLAERVRGMHPFTRRAWSVGVMAKRVREGQDTMRSMLQSAMRVMQSPDRKDDAAAARFASPFAFARRQAGFELRDSIPGADASYVLIIGPHDAIDWKAIEKQTVPREMNDLLPQ